MPEEPEVPMEHLHEAIHEGAEKGGGRWSLFVALTAALLAVIAAMTSLLAGHHANEALIEQIQASDQWAYYQSKGIKSAVLEGKIEMLRALEKEPSAKDEEKLKEYKAQQKEIEEIAGEKEKSSDGHLRVHNILAKAVTFFQIAIAIAALSILTRRRWLWFLSLALALGGLASLAQGIF